MYNIAEKCMEVKARIGFSKRLLSNVFNADMSEFIIIVLIFCFPQLFDRMCMALGGRVAESIMFNRVTTGELNISLIVDVFYLC